LFLVHLRIAAIAIWQPSQLLQQSPCGFWPDGSVCISSASLVYVTT
jgi:hypothetical protein